jgi:hypothetical protein
MFETNKSYLPGIAIEVSRYFRVSPFPLPIPPDGSSYHQSHGTSLPLFFFNRLFGALQTSLAHYFAKVSLSTAC